MNVTAEIKIVYRCTLTRRAYFTRRAAYYAAAKRLILDCLEKRDLAITPYAAGADHFHTQANPDHPDSFEGFDSARWRRTVKRLAKMLMERDQRRFRHGVPDDGTS